MCYRKEADMGRKILGGIIVAIAAVIFCYYGVWMFLISGIKGIIIGLRDNMEARFVFAQFAKVLIGFPIVEIIAGFILIIGVDIHNKGDQ